MSKESTESFHAAGGDILDEGDTAVTDRDIFRVYYIDRCAVTGIAVETSGRIDLE